MALALLVVASYGSSLGAPLMFDDMPNLVDNTLMVFDPAVFEGWRTATMSGESGVLLRPISMFSFAVNHSIGNGFDPVALKAGNLLLHLLCAGLVYQLAQALFSAQGAWPDKQRVNRLALLAAAVWVLHPLHVSTVLYAVQRMAQLSTFFVLLGLLVYSRYRLRWLRNLPQFGEVLALLLWGALITCLAMLSKENGVLLPWLALVLEVAVFRGRLGGKEYPLLQRMALLLLLAPALLVILIYLANPAALTAGFAGRDFTLEERVLSQLRILWHYFYWFAWPDIRNMGFQHDDIVLSRDWLQPYTTAVAGVGWGLLLALAVYTRKRFPLLLLALAFYLVAHALESSALPLELAFEHRNYLPSVGLALLTAGLLGSIQGRFPAVRAPVLVAPLLSVLALLLLVRCHIWSDMERFSRFNAVNHPGSPRAQFFYGDALYSQIGSEGGPDGTGDGALLLAARNQFIRVNEAAGGHATALVMLYFADEVYLSELADRPDWLPALSAALLSDSRLNSSDYTAIESLASCAIQGVCEADRLKVLQLVDALLERAPGNYRLLELRYQLTLAAGMERERLETLAQLEILAPHVPTLYSYLVTEHAANASRAEVYAALAAWLRHDRVRKYLPMLSAIAARQAGAAVSPAHPATPVGVELQ